MQTAKQLTDESRVFVAPVPLRHAVRNCPSPSSASPSKLT